MLVYMNSPRSDAPLACIVCKKALASIFTNPVDDGHYVQPSKACTFESYGIFGSEVFDPMDGSYLILNVCDECLSAGQESGLIQHFEMRR